MSRRALFTGFVLVGLFILGTAGYSILEGWSLLDSAYMTVITLSTVGFGEVHPLSQAGRVFTIVLTLGGVGAVAYALSNMFEILLSEDALEVRREKRRQTVIDHIENHVIICGYGQMGRLVAEGLEQESLSFVIVDPDREIVAEARRGGHLALIGDASHEEILERAGIERARTVIVTVGTDAESVFIVLTARGMNQKLTIIARADQVHTEAKLLKAGADRVILPLALGGQRMVSLVNRSGVADFLDVVMRSGELEFRLEEIPVPKTSPRAGVTLADLQPRREYGVTVLAIVLPGKRTLTNPQATDKLEPESRVIALGTVEALRSFRRSIAPE